jgi:hypothetical protein
MFKAINVILQQMKDTLRLLSFHLCMFLCAVTTAYSFGSSRGLHASNLVNNPPGFFYLHVEQFVFVFVFLFFVAWGGRGKC